MRGNGVVHAMFDFVERARGIDRDNLSALRVRTLPARLGELIEGRGDAIVKAPIGALKAIGLATLARAVQTFRDGQSQEDREIRHQALRGEFVRRTEFSRRQSTAVDLVRVGGEQEAIEQDVLPRGKRRLHHRVHQLRARRHEQAGLSGGCERQIGVQEDLADAIPHGRAAGFAIDRVVHAIGGETRREALELGGLPRSLASLEDYELTAQASELSPA